jgi:hypothetical protein
MVAGGEVCEIEEYANPATPAKVVHSHAVPSFK